MLDRLCTLIDTLSRLPASARSVEGDEAEERDENAEEQHGPTVLSALVTASLDLCCEAMQGPCAENQQHLSLSGLVESCMRLWHECEPGQRLPCLLAEVLLAMLEGQQPKAHTVVYAKMLAWIDESVLEARLSANYVHWQETRKS